MLRTAIGTRLHFSQSLSNRALRRHPVPNRLPQHRGKLSPQHRGKLSPQHRGKLSPQHRGNPLRCPLHILSKRYSNSACVAFQTSSKA